MRSKKKLKMRRETLRDLVPGQLRRAAGGSGWSCFPCDYTENCDPSNFTACVSICVVCPELPPES